MRGDRPGRVAARAHRSVRASVARARGLVEVALVLGIAGCGLWLIGHIVNRVAEPLIPLVVMLGVAATLFLTALVKYGLGWLDRRRLAGREGVRQRR